MTRTRPLSRLCHGAATVAAQGTYEPIESGYSDSIGFFRKLEGKRIGYACPYFGCRCARMHPLKWLCRRSFLVLVRIAPFRNISPGKHCDVCIGHEISCVCDVRLVRWCRLSQNRSPAIPKTGDLCQNAHQCAQGDGEARQVAPMEPMLRGGRTVNVARCTGDIE